MCRSASTWRGTLSNVGTMQVFARNAVARERQSASLMTTPAALALALAVLGVYGVMSYSIAMRQQRVAFTTNVRFCNAERSSSTVLSAVAVDN